MDVGKRLYLINSDRLWQHYALKPLLTTLRSSNGSTGQSCMLSGDNVCTL